MMDHGTAALRQSLARPELAPDLLAKIQPVNLSRDRLIEVPDLLLPLFPDGGIQRGWSLGLDGHGSWGVAMALLASGLGQEGWVAIVGLPTFNLAAAAHYGLRLDRVLLVDEPGPGRLAMVLATLLEAVDIVVLSPQSRVGARDARRLVARAREQESILFHLDGGTTWPTKLNLSLSTSVVGWDGLGQGHGHLRSRQVRVEAHGRRGSAQKVSVDVLLPDAKGRLAPAETGGLDTASLAPVESTKLVKPIVLHPLLAEIESGRVRALS